MDYHHVIEAAGIVSLGLVFYSYLIRALDGAPAAWRRWRPVATGVAFGAVAVALMIARIYVGHDRFIDARAVPIALVTFAVLLVLGLSVWNGWLVWALFALLTVLYFQTAMAPDSSDPERAGESLPPQSAATTTTIPGR